MRGWVHEIRRLVGVWAGLLSDQKYMKKKTVEKNFFRAPTVFYGISIKRTPKHAFLLHKLLFSFFLGEKLGEGKVFSVS